MAVNVRDMTDSVSQRIGVVTGQGLVLIRFYEDGSILVGHTDASDVILKPNYNGQQAGVRIEWDMLRPVIAG